MQEMLDMWIQALGHRGPLEEEMAAPARILAWEIPWTEDPDMLQSLGLQESDTTWQLNN